MTSEEALVGIRVKVREDHHSARWRGGEGTIRARWGRPDYVALDVVMDDGLVQLFWHHEVQPVDNKNRNGSIA